MENGNTATNWIDSLQAAFPGTARYSRDQQLLRFHMAGLRIRIRIILESWIRVRIEGKIWIPIRIMVKAEQLDPDPDPRPGPQ